MPPLGNNAGSWRGKPSGGSGQGGGAADDMGVKGGADDGKSRGAQYGVNLGRRGDDRGKSGVGSQDMRKGAEGPEFRGSGGGRQSRIFSGMRILLLGFASRSSDELKGAISDMGGLALSPSKYDMCTHICIEGESTCRGRIITKEWIMKCHDHNTLLELDETSSDAECSKLVSTTKKRRLMQGVRCSSNGRRTKRKLCFGDEEEDELYMQLHQLLLCKADNSEKMLNLCHVVDQMKTMVKTVVTPGSVKHETTSTLYKVKLLIKKIYNLIKSLHAAGYSLRGKFTSSNFVIDETNIEQYIRFAFLPKGVLQLWDSDGEELDMKGFEKMVRREIFKAEIVPHDINFWLSLIGEKELEGLLPWHVSLMSVPQCSESFTTWYDTFTNLENQEVYERIVKNLSQYNGWQKDIRGNGLLEETFDYCDPKTSKPVTYNDDVIDLLRLLRNSRQHSSKYRHDEFALIVGQIYPDLLADFQIELFKEGCIDQIN